MWALDLELDFPLLLPPTSDILPLHANKSELKTYVVIETFSFSFLGHQINLHIIHSDHCPTIQHGINEILI